MAIILDDRVQGQPPIINGQIGQHGQIELGSKPLQDAQDLALVLRAGALPAPLTIVDESTIGPSLGQDSIRDRKSTRLNSSHSQISYAVFCLKKKTTSRTPSSRSIRIRIRHRPGSTA